MTENIIFDVDGTLWDAAEAVARAWNVVYARRRLTRRFTEKDVGECMGLTLGEIEEKFFSSFPPDEKRAIIDECLAEQNALLRREGGKPYPLVKETLAELSRQYGVYIVSNCECGYIEALLEATGMGPFVRDFLCAGMTGKGKGDNLVILMEKNKLKNCVYVGDTRTDEAACEQAGIPFVWAAYGFGCAESPAAAVKSIVEVKEAVKKL